MSRVKLCALGALMLLVPWAAEGKQFIVLSAGQSIPPGLQSSVEAAGAATVSVLPEIGLLVLESSDPAFPQRAAGVKGVRSVVPDLTLELVPAPDDAQAQFLSFEEAGALGLPKDGFLPLQWGLTAIQWQRAYLAGATGAGVRVAVLDNGVDWTHPDLAANVNRPLSASFVPGEGVLPVNKDIPFHHGTHVSGIVAAAGNGIGVVGVAPRAEVVAVKVLSEKGTGAFSGVVAGLLYAAKIQADVVNMSFAAILQRSGVSFCPADPAGCYSARDAAELVVAATRAVNYADQHGVTLVAAAGNDRIDFDHTADLIAIPAQLPNVIAVAATAPHGWGVDQTVSLDDHAAYSNYGQSAITLSAPGGDYDQALVSSGARCKVAGVVLPCWAFDLVASTNKGGWAFMSGTSMASPHVVGTAALVIERNGAKMEPAQVRAALTHGADDLGKPGVDDFYGHGRVNAAASLE